MLRGLRNRCGGPFGCGVCNHRQTFSCAWGKAVLYCPTKISVQGEVKILTGGNGSGNFAATLRSPRALCRLGSLPRSARELQNMQGRPGGIPGPTVTVRMEEQGKHTREALMPRAPSQHFATSAASPWRRLRPPSFAEHARRFPAGVFHAWRQQGCSKRKGNRWQA